MNDEAMRRWAVGLCVLLLAALGALSLQGCAGYGKCEGAACAEDARITQDVQRLFAQHPEFANQLSVKTINRVVYLSGQAATGLQRDSAASLAGGVPGVENVVNNIYVNNMR